MSAAIGLASLPVRALQSETAPAGPTVHDRVLTLEIDAADPAVDGRGPSVTTEYVVDFRGTLHVWTRSDQDLFLRVEDRAGGTVLAQDEDSGGGSTPYTTLDVAPESVLVVTVANAVPGPVAPFELCFAASPASKAAASATALGQAALDAIAGSLAGLGPADPTLPGLRAGYATEVTRVLATAGGEVDEGLAEVLGLLAIQADSLQLTGSATAIRSTLVQYQDRTRPESHGDILLSRLQLASSFSANGDRAGASSLLLGTVQTCNSFRPPNDPLRIRALSQLARCRWQLGDLRGALDLNQQLLDVRLGDLGADDPEILILRQTGARWLSESGDLEAATALQRSVLEDCQRLLPANHPVLIQAQRQLALSLGAGGDTRGAITLQEAALTGLAATRPALHPQLLSARLELASSMCGLRDFQAALGLQRDVVSAYASIASLDRVGLLSARESHALTFVELGDLDGAVGQADVLANGMQAHLLDIIASPSARVRDAALTEADRLDLIQFLAARSSAGSGFGARAIELGESLRWVVAQAGRSPVGPAGDAAIDSILATRAGLQAALAGIQGAGIGDGELLRISSEGARIADQLRVRVADRASLMGAFGPAGLAAVLGPDEVAVGYRRISPPAAGPSTGPVGTGVDHLLASVVRPDGTFSWVDLGPMGEIELLIAAWRAAIGQPVGGGSVSIRVSQAGTDADRSAGRRLRQRVLDPVLALAGEGARTFFVAPDDSLFLIPIDGLPMESGERVGDVLRIASQVSFGSLLVPRIGPLAPPGFLVVGGAAYGEAATGVRSLRLGSGSSTGAQVLAAANLFQGLARTEAVVLTRGEATKSALFDRAPGMRYLHLAVQGWTGQGPPDTSVRGVNLQSSNPVSAPGLALAQANLGQDALGRFPGILTFDQLSSLDLFACELAVVTPWQPTAGLGPDAQVIQSLQTALFAAGARSSIVSLWPVTEEVSTRLMHHFYTFLWGEELGKADALWRAKQALRDEGHPPSHWAGWVLSGDPE